MGYFKTYLWVKKKIKNPLSTSSLTSDTEDDLQYKMYSEATDWKAAGLKRSHISEETLLRFHSHCFDVKDKPDRILQI